eukprot:1162339-Pyramimonas_sp.AAC.1
MHYNTIGIDPTAEQHHGITLCGLMYCTEHNVTALSYYCYHYGSELDIPAGTISSLNTPVIAEQT